MPIGVNLLRLCCCCFLVVPKASTIIGEVTKTGIANIWIDTVASAMTIIASQTKRVAVEVTKRETAQTGLVCTSIKGCTSTERNATRGGQPAIVCNPTIKWQSAIKERSTIVSTGSCMKVVS